MKRLILGSWANRDHEDQARENHAKYWDYLAKNDDSDAVFDLN